MAIKKVQNYTNIDSTGMHLYYYYLGCSQAAMQELNRQ